MTDLEKCDLQYTLNKSEIFQRELTDIIRLRVIADIQDGCSCDEAKSWLELYNWVQGELWLT